MRSNLWNPELLRGERKERGWSQAKMAEVLGVDVTTVRRWERGQAIPYPYHRRKMIDLFGETALISLARWFAPAGEDRCYLQISGWYL